MFFSVRQQNMGDEHGLETAVRWVSRNANAIPNAEAFPREPSTRRRVRGIAFELPLDCCSGAILGCNSESDMGVSPLDFREHAFELQKRLHVIGEDGMMCSREPGHTQDER
jgi:hypothetical protein